MSEKKLRLGAEVLTTRTIKLLGLFVFVFLS